MQERFDKINELYAEYQKASAMANTELAIKGIEDKIIIEVCKSKKIYGEYAAEVIITTRDALKSYYPNSKAYKKGKPFSQYLFGSLKKSINTSSEKADLADKNGGNTTTDYLLKQIHKFKKFCKKHLDLDEESLIQEAVQELKIKEQKIRIILKFIEASTSGTEKTNEDGEVFLNPAIQENSNKNSLENWLIDKEKRELVLPEIQKEWEKKSDQMLSELLTVKVMQTDLDFENIEDYSFLNKKIYYEFLKDPEHKLPEQQEIAEKYGLTKSEASKVLSRFWEKIRKK